MERDGGKIATFPRGRECRGGEREIERGRERKTVRLRAEAGAPGPPLLLEEEAGGGRPCEEEGRCRGGGSNRGKRGGGSGSRLRQQRVQSSIAAWSYLLPSGVFEITRCPSPPSPSCGFTVVPSKTRKFRPALVRNSPKSPPLQSIFFPFLVFLVHYSEIRFLWSLGSFSFRFMYLIHVCQIDFMGASDHQMRSPCSSQAAIL